MSLSSPRPNSAPAASIAELEAMSLSELAGLLEDPRPGARADAACAIGDRLRTRAVLELPAALVDRLVLRLDDADIGVRFEAAVALAEARDKRATPLLLGATRVRAVRLDAIRALGTLGDPASVPSLRGFVTGWFVAWADRLQAAAALCALGDPQGAEYLVRASRSRRYGERAAAVHFLGESRHPQAVSLLAPLALDAREPLRDVAVRALGLCDDPTALPVLDQLAEVSDPELRADISDARARLAAVLADRSPQ